MLPGNLINLDDFRYLYQNSRKIPTILGMALRLPQSRVRANWATNEGKPSSFGMLNRVQQYMKTKMSGDPNKDYIDHFLEVHVPQHTGMNALAIGCGEGDLVIRLAKTGQFSKILGIDLAEGAIQTAQTKALQEHVEDITEFRVCNIHQAQFSEQEFDVILAEHCLHHFTPLEPIVIRLSTWLKHQGFLVWYEFIGPERFQWTARQLEVSNALLEILPKSYRIQNTNGAIKQRVPRPSRLRMHVGDPSEAVESSQIMTLLQRHLQQVEFKPCGGTILHPLLHGIAHNFQKSDALTCDLLDLIIQAEESLMQSGDLVSDFATGICRRVDR